MRDLIKEVYGLAPYEKRVCELLRVGKDKRALKLTKRKLGTHKRAKKKREEMSTILRKQKYFFLSMLYELCYNGCFKQILVVNDNPFVEADIYFILSRKTKN